MLQEIYIKNFVLIDELKISFTKGLNILTGETGAGKSIIIDALGLILGERIKSDLIKDESQKALIDAVIDINNNKEAHTYLIDLGLIDREDDIIVLTREIHNNGKSTARINRRSVNIKTLKDLSFYLIDMHLQHDNLRILKPEKYLEFVDSFADNSNLLKEIKQIYQELNTKKKELANLVESEKDRLQKIDFLTYQINEIENLNLEPKEEEELIKLRDRIQNSQLLLESSEKILSLIYSGNNNNSAYDLISEGVNICMNLEKEPFFKELANEMEEITYIIQDMSTRIASFRDSLDFEPDSIDHIENRLYEINKVKRKYGEDIKGVLLHLQQAKEEREQLYKSKETQVNLQEIIENLEDKYKEIAHSLTHKRKEAAENFEKQVYKELYQLNMPHTQFKVEVMQKEFSYTGWDEIEFLFSANPGEALQPISRVASGGEISRFILGLKKAVAEFYNVPTLIFDEIDVGLGGETLNIIAQKLAEFSSTHQVILVTHSPQIASYSDNHYLIQKEIVNNTTNTTVKLLNEKAKELEISRMLGGTKSNTTLKHAQELLKKATTFKESLL
ncbi:DNA repair protein RecN [Candidatus Syntrophocurvum alkaliphilum]|uniref:DNA repair protein RecN n=1 Tax=Candidatus Syntrophocurvum alkaliphilum TaxID=2293317 RepID=A0A6I6DBZ9_9FIRM|nr:DNA repair protein RecN [Candidatus Syntrophocurvum alkaliphilum]QGT98974.1 DNA repair protein RecN [Candidatus Syntrophocurvum alkaliphilum]